MKLPATGRGPNRWQILAWGSGTALALVFGQSVLANTPITVDDFTTLSARLLDRPEKGLSGYAGDYFDNLVAMGQGDALAAMVGGGADGALENTIVSQWYTGLQQTPNGEAVVTYTDALMWQALDFTKPMGWCGGQTGYWADAPEGEA